MPATLTFEWRDRDATVLGDAACFAEDEVFLSCGEGEQRAPYRSP